MSFYWLSVQARREKGNRGLTFEAYEASFGHVGL
jgi:hypothetical protein